MSDDLKADHTEELRNLCQSLEDTLSDATLIIDRQEDRIEELEAKLAKEEVINSLLTVVAILKDPSDVRFPEALDLAERFSTTIAELKGPSHE